MKRRGKLVLVGGIFLTLLAIVWWLCVPGPQPVPAPGLSFIGFTNNVAGKRVAVLSISNASHRAVHFAPIVELPAKDGSYERWAAGAPERPPTPLAAGAGTTCATEIPDPGSFWRLRVIWQPQPSRL